MTINYDIALAEPSLNGLEVSYVLDALKHRQLSGGPYVSRFEAAFSSLCGCSHGVATSSGTTALHLILAALGIGPGDEVIIPAITFVATAHVVRLVGATPVLVDVDPLSWCIDPRCIEDHITSNTRAVIAVHLYGHPANMTELRRLCEGWDLYLIEDAAEAHGAYCDGRPVGSLGHAAAFSFYGNKILTTGEGGMVTTNDDAFDARLRLLRGQGQDPDRRYWHTEVGFNFRLGELQGAIGLAQTEEHASHFQARLRIAEWYRRFAPELMWQEVAPYAESAYWMNVATFENRDIVADHLRSVGIETRPAFYVISDMPPYKDCGPSYRFRSAEYISRHGLCLPTHANLTAGNVHDICHEIKKALA